MTDKLVKIDENIWMPYELDTQYVNFNFDKLGAFLTTVILGGSILIWVFLAYILGNFEFPSWAIYVLLSIWLVALSYTILQKKNHHRITFLAVVLPPLITTFLVHYLPNEGIYYYSAFTVGLVVLLAYFTYWIKKVYKELADESVLLFISAISLFITALSQILILVPTSIDNAIFEAFPFFPVALLLWSSEPFVWVRMIFGFSVFLGHLEKCHFYIYLTGFSVTPGLYTQPVADFAS